jgi:hypothetical protein
VPKCSFSNEVFKDIFISIFLSLFEPDLDSKLFQIKELRKEEEKKWKSKTKKRKGENKREKGPRQPFWSRIRSGPWPS